MRVILHDHFDEEFAQRFIGFRDNIERTPLNSLGPWHQMHADGHEKLTDKALEMGTVTLPIYGMKDQYSAWVHYLCVHPNVRLQSSALHIFLDSVEMNDYSTISVDSLLDILLTTPIRNCIDPCH